MSAHEEDAFVEFARTFGPRFRAYFVRRGLNLGDAEELSVSCVTDIALKVDKYQQLRVGGFEAWVYTLARRALSDWWRARRPAEPLSEDFAAPGGSGADAEGADDEADAGVIMAVRDALGRLSESDRTLIVLRHFGREHTYAEVSERLGVTQQAARVRYFRARNRLKELLLEDARIRESYKRLEETKDE